MVKYILTGNPKEVKKVLQELGIRIKRGDIIITPLEEEPTNDTKEPIMNADTKETIRTEDEKTIEATDVKEPMTDSDTKEPIEKKPSKRAKK